MIAKIIVHGPTRAVALNRLARALDQTQVAGTVTNLGFLGALARHPGFAAGEVDTGLIARDLAALTATRAPDDLDMAMAATAFLQAADLPEGPLAGFTLWAPQRHGVALARGAEVEAAVIEAGAAGASVELRGEVVQARRVGAGWAAAGRAPMDLACAAGMIHVFAPGRVLSFARVDALDRAAAAGVAGNVTRSPMPGLVRAVAVAAGQAVKAGERLAVLEAMKMEHVLVAARDGVVAEVLVAPGAQVEAGAALIVLED